MVLDEAIRGYVLARRVARLATADGGGRPHVVPLCYAFDGAAFYFVVDDKPKRPSARPLKRIRNIEANPQVALLIDDYSEDWSRLAWVRIDGTAAIVEDPEEHARALALLRARYPQYRDMPLAFGRNPVVRIVPERARAWGRIGPP